MNELLAPFMKGGKEMASADGFWEWCPKFARYFHDDEDTGIRVYFPRVVPPPDDELLVPDDPRDGSEVASDDK